MIVNVFVHGMDDPLARECCGLEEIKKYIIEIGWDRIDKITITDFRPIVKECLDGTKEIVCPDI